MKIIITERQLKYIVNILNEDFKSQKIKYIEQGNDEAIIDRYLKDFREIKDREYSEFLNSDLPGLNVPKGNDRKNIDNYKTFKEVELIVDYMAGQRNVGSANFSDIKVDGKPIYNDEDVEIYYAPNKESCVRYKGDKSYSWCISRTDSSNMFMKYRTSPNRPSFYFVKRKDATEKEFDYWNTSGDKFQGKFNDKYHFFVVQALANNNYIVTSAQNDGDMRMTWEEILKFAPELQEKQNYFETKPLSDTEIAKYEKYRKGFSDEEFIKLPYVEKEYYLDTAIDYYRSLTDRQFESLPDDLKNKYINFGLELTPGQFSMIKDNKKLLGRYKDIINDEFERNFVSNESVLPDFENDDNQQGFFFFRIKVSEFDPKKYQYLNEKNKKFADHYIRKEFNNKLDRWGRTINMFGGDYFNLAESFIEKNELPSLLPNIFYLKTLIPKEKILNNEKLLKFLFFLYLSVSKEDFNEFVNYLGININDIVSSFKTKGERNLYKKLMNKR
jgi:hypothetical protein